MQPQTVMKCAMLLALGVAWAPRVLADQPRLRPSRDVDVIYHTSGTPDGRPAEQRVRWMAASQIMRIDPPSPGLHVIIDYVARRMSVVRDATRTVIEMAAPDSMAMMDEKVATFVRHGEATVAGHTCTEWQTQDTDARAVLVCITGDGVLLRAGTVDQVRVSAVSVNYAPQDAQEFRVPPGYVRQAPEAAR